MSLVSNIDTSSQSNLFEELLMELLDPSTTLERALQSMSSPCLLPEVYTVGDEPVVMFLAYMRYIMVRRPDACVDGIWEVILMKTIRYSRKCNVTPILGLDTTHVRRSYNIVLPPGGPQVSTWLDKAFSCYEQCLNPYTRLDLFCLIIIFQSDLQSLTWNFVYYAFINTICDIQPHFLYPSDCMEDVNYSFHDFQYFIKKHGLFRLDFMISQMISKQLKKTDEVFANSKVARFLTNYIQLIGVFAVRARSMSDPFKQIDFICDTFYQLGKLVIFGKHLVSNPPFWSCVIETVRDLTVTIINNYSRGIVKPRGLILRDMTDAIGIRDNQIWNLDVSTKRCKLPRFSMRTCDLPKLLLLRQVNGPKLVHQHCLLLENLQKLNNRINKKDSYEDSDEDSDEDSEEDSD